MSSGVNRGEAVARSKLRDAKGLAVLLGLLACVLAAVAVVAGCGEGDDGGGEAAGAGEASAGVKTAARRRNEFLREPELKTVGEPFDASRAAGSTVYYLNTSDSIPVTVSWQKPVVEALERYGVEVITADGKGNPSEYNKLLSEAIAREVDAIFMLAVTPTLVKNQLARAKEAGIPVVTGVDGHPDVKKTPTWQPGVVAGVSFDYDKVGRLEADWFIESSSGEGKGVLVTVDDQPSSPFVRRGFEAELEELCPACEIEVVDIPVAQTAQRMPAVPRTVLARNPDFTYLLPQYDYMVPGLMQGLRETGLTNDVQMGTWNAEPAIMEMLKDPDNPVKSQIGVPNRVYSFAVADTMLRILAGEDPVVWCDEKSNYCGMRAFDEETVQDIDVSEFNDEEWYGLPESEVDAAFEELWGPPPG